MKRLLFLITLGSLFFTACTKDPVVKSLEERLHGDWHGVRIENHLIAQGLWDTIHPHSTTDLIATFDTLAGTFVVDSLGQTLDSASLVIAADSTFTVSGADNAIDWSFDRSLINGTGLPILDQLEASFTGNQKFDIEFISDDELELYFVKLIPVNYQGFQATMELRHTEYWQK